MKGFENWGLWMEVLDEREFVKVSCEDVERNGASKIFVLNGGDYTQRIMNRQQGAIIT